MAAFRSLCSRWSSLMPTYMSAVPRSTGCALLRRQLQSPLIGAHGLAETTLRNPYIRQGDGAPDYVRDVPGLLHTRHALGIRPVRCLEIPARPGCESQERRRRIRARDGRPRVRGRAPAGRILWCRPHRPESGQLPARYMAIEPGRRRNSSSSTTTIVSRWGFRSLTPVTPVVSSHRSASRSRASTPSSSPLTSNAPA